LSSALFTRQGDLFRPTVHARGPWDPRALHGGPLAMLVVRAIEALPAETPMQVTRLSLELLRPAPLEAIEVQAQAVRSGRRVQTAAASVRSGGEELVRATATRIRRARAEFSTASGDGWAPPPGPEAFESFDQRGGAEAFHSTGMEFRFISGHLQEPGPAVAWSRLRLPLLEDEPLTPLQRVCAAADFGNGISWVLPWESYLFINPDLTIELFREPAGEWVGLDAVTWLGDESLGLAESALFDEKGRLGRALQTLVIDRRQGSRPT